MTRWDGMSREDLERPVSQGGMSMGHGRRLVPPPAPAHAGGTIFEDCPRSPRPDRRHEYTAVSNLNSVEHFVCDFGCGEEFSD